MQYSVSPRFTLISLGPKPRENVSTRTPIRRAIRKCPSSCTKMRTPRTNKKASTVNISPGGREPEKSRDRLYSSRGSGRERTSPSVDLPHVGEAADASGPIGLVPVHGVANDVGNARKSQALAEECRHRHLVR